MFYPNLKRRLIAVIIQINHAEKKGVSNIAKSSYYRAAIILTCTIIEGIVYELVKNIVGCKPCIIGDRIEWKVVQKLSPTITGDTKKMFVCEKKKKDIYIDDNQVGFGSYLIYLKNKKILNPTEYKAVNIIRIERNKIHLQSIKSSDTGYTKRKFNSITQTLMTMLDIFEKTIAVKSKKLPS